jgi:hypothetical protein
LTPFLLARLAEITQGKSLKANQSLVLENSRLAARIARAVVSNPKESEILLAMVPRFHKAERTFSASSSTMACD